MHSSAENDIVEEVVGLDDSPLSRAVTVSRNPAEIREASRQCFQKAVRPRTTDEVKQQLTYCAIPEDARGLNASSNTKRDALALYRESYCADDEAVEFTFSICSKFRYSMSRRNFDDPEYREFYFNIDKILKGDALRPVPSSLKALRDLFFLVEAPPSGGKTAYLGRLVQMFETPFRFYGTGKQPAFMSVVPCLSILYPSCGTVAGMLREIRYRILEQVGRVDTVKGVIPEITGDDSVNAIISLCVTMNVGVLAIDGACFKSLAGEPQEVVNMLVRLQQRSGIVVVFAATPVFLHCLSLAGGSSSSFFSGQMLNLGALKAASDGEGKLDTNSPLYQFISWLWSAGPLPDGTTMHAELPQWVESVALGRRGWTVQVMEELHLKLVKEPALIQNLTYEQFKKFALRKLAYQLPPRAALIEWADRRNLEDDRDFYNFIDHFPKAIFNLKKYKSLLHAGR